MPSRRSRNRSANSSGLIGSTDSNVQERRLTRSAAAFQLRVGGRPEFDSSTPLQSQYQHALPATAVQSALATSYPNLARKANGFRATRRRFVKRFQYTMSEDLAILNYLLEHNLIDKVNQRSTWYELERNNVTRHSAESMRVRVLRSLVHQLSSLLPNIEQEKIEFLRSHLLTGRLRGQKPQQRPLTPVTPSSPSTRLRSSRTAVASAETSRLTNDISPPPSADPMTSLSQSRVSESFVTEDGFNSGGPSARQCSTPSKAPANQSLPLFSSDPTEPSVEGRRNLRLAEPRTRMPRRTTKSSLDTACLLPKGRNERGVESPSLTTIVSSTVFAVRSVDHICRLFPFLRNADVYLLLYMTGGSLSAVRALLHRLTSSHSATSDGCGGDIDGKEADGQPALWLPKDDCRLLSTDQAEVSEVLAKFGLRETLRRMKYLTGGGPRKGARH
nr:unnamed protein product [Spirometra erinaceieuropaei]